MVKIQTPFISHLTFNRHLKLRLSKTELKTFPPKSAVPLMIGTSVNGVSIYIFSKARTFKVTPNFASSRHMNLSYIFHLLCPMTIALLQRTIFSSIGLLPKPQKWSGFLQSILHFACRFTVIPRYPQGIGSRTQQGLQNPRHSNPTVGPLYPWFCICRFNQPWIL